MSKELVWDEDKRRRNLRKHGFDFVDGERIFGGRTLTFEDTRFDYGEQRLVTIGLLEGRIVVVVHTESDDTIRIISIRKATRYEAQTYFEYFAH